MTNSPGPGTALLADIGGTFVRFALSEADGRVHTVRIFKTADFPSLLDAARAYLSACGMADAPRVAAFAIAGPVEGDRIAMTNRAWAFSVADLRRAMALDRLDVINDFAAVAEAIPGLGPDALHLIGGRPIVPGSPPDFDPRAVLGPGTGLGAALLVPGANGFHVIATEGGHVTLCATDARETAILDHLRARFGHVSAERVLSGPGLVNLANAITAVDGRAIDSTLTPESVTELAAQGTSAPAVEAMRVFSGLLGTIAGNQVLTTGALGGLYIAGGVVLRLGRRFDRGLFRERFEAKGRFNEYLKPVPTYLVTADEPALTGLARLVRRPPSAQRPPSAKPA